MLVGGLAGSATMTGLRYCHVDLAESLTIRGIMANDRQILGQTIRQHRLRRRVSQGELGQLHQVSQQYVSQVEASDYDSIPVDLLFRISESLGTYDLLDRQNIGREEKDNLAVQYLEKLEQIASNKIYQIIQPVNQDILAVSEKRISFASMSRLNGDVETCEKIALDVISKLSNQLKEGYSNLMLPRLLFAAYNEAALAIMEHHPIDVIDRLNSLCNEMDILVKEYLFQDEEIRSIALFHRADLGLVSNGRYNQRGIQASNKALELHSSIETKLRHIRVRIGLHRLAGDRKEVIRQLMAFEKLVAKDGIDPIVRSFVLQGVALNLNKLGRGEQRQALSMLSEGESTYREAEYIGYCDSGTESMILRTKAIILEKRGPEQNYDIATDSVMRALEIAKETGRRRTINQCHDILHAIETREELPD